MERRYRLQKNKAFQYVYHRGRSAACRDLVMLVAKGRGMKVGFSVSKKVGNAVTRNKVKRRLRECFRPYLGDVKSGLYVVVARPSAAAASFSSLQKDVRYGAVKGARLAAWRVLRCNPFSKGGYDPVPEDPCTTLRKE